MSFDKELRVVMIAALGLLAYLSVASAAMIFVHNNFGMTPFIVAWLVVLIIPLNFVICSILCIVFYRRKEKKFKEVKEQLTELSDLATFEYDKKYEYDKKLESDRKLDYDKKREDKREEKLVHRTKASSEIIA